MKAQHLVENKPYHTFNDGTVLWGDPQAEKLYGLEDGIEKLSIMDSQITSLEGIPSSVRKTFSISGCKNIKDFTGFPTITSLSLLHMAKMDIESFKGLDTNLVPEITIVDSNIKSFEGLPKNVYELDVWGGIIERFDLPSDMYLERLFLSRVRVNDFSKIESSNINSKFVNLQFDERNRSIDFTGIDEVFTGVKGFAMNSEITDIFGLESLYNLQSTTMTLHVKRQDLQMQLSKLFEAKCKNIYEFQELAYDLDLGDYLNGRDD